MQNKRKPIKETKTRYRTKRKPATIQSSAVKITLRWSDIENATQPIILERNGHPVAVVIKYSDWKSALRTEDVWKNELAAMAADPQIQNELRQIEKEFALTEVDGLHKLP